MAVKLVNVDRNTPMLLPPDLRDWVPDNHIVHFIIEAVEQLPLANFRFNHRGSGSPQYPPAMMLELLIYCYATGRFSSRQIEMATYQDVAVRYLCGGEHHPDHDTICAFRRQNRDLFEESFVQVLELAREMKVLKKVGTVSLDGTKVQANASKHAAVSYKRAGAKVEELRREVQQLLAKAEDADSKPLEEGLSVPGEIARREERIKRLEKARAAIEQRCAKQRLEKQAEYEKKMSEREKKRAGGQAVKGRPPQPPPAQPPDQEQYNFTDEESRIMKAGNGNHFEQSYNAQAAVETETMLILGQRVSAAPNDKKQLEAGVDSIPAQVFRAKNVLVDNGYYSEDAVQKVEEKHKGVTVYAAVGKPRHHRTVEDLEKKEEPPEPPPGASGKEKMAHRMSTKPGQEIYKQRKQTVEPVFGIIKEVMGFRRFSLRGKKKAGTEWTLVCLAYNCKRLFNLAKSGIPMTAAAAPG